MRFRGARTGSAAVLLAFAVAMSACGPPSPRSLVGLAKRAERKGDRMEMLKNVELLQDLAPRELQSKSRGMKEFRATYVDAQIAFGLEEARKAKEAKELIDAWIWLVQISLVDPERAECKAAQEEARKTRTEIAAMLAQEAQDALGKGDPVKAIQAAVRSLWFEENDQAKGLLEQAGTRADAYTASWRFDPMKDDDVAGHLRTDSLSLMREPPVFAPYGVPIFFGDVPYCHYSLGQVMVKGTPMPYGTGNPKALKYLPKGSDSLALLSRVAARARRVERKRVQADAIINVMYERTAFDVITSGELIKYVEAPEASNGGTVREAVTVLPPSAKRAEGTPAPGK